jgi:ubiquinone/menaquinone biosynthesis C-methylase UbiE
MKGHATVSAVTPASQPDFEGIKQRQQKVWKAGRYNLLGSRIVPMAELLVIAVDPLPGMKVLDVGSGTGNAALAAARRFCDVISTDFVPEMLEFGRIRAAADDLDVAFEVADAENLPYPDATFDVVLSTVGVMFAPDQERAASELLRVCKPGGKIGLANWTPDSFNGQMMPVIGKYLPPPPGLKPPVRWGTEQGLQELIGDGVDSMQIRRKEQTFSFLSLDHYFDVFRTTFGPIKTSFDALSDEHQRELEQILRGMITEINRSGDSRVIYEMAYLEVVAVRA